MLRFSLRLVWLLACVPLTSVAQRDVANAAHAVLEISSISPAAPVTGDRVVVTFVARNTSLGDVTLSGDVFGTFQDQPLKSDAGASSVTVTLPPGGTASGSLSAVASLAGTGVVDITFRRPCVNPPNRRPRPCKSDPYTAASDAIDVAQKMVDVRIAGVRFMKLTKGDPLDGFYEKNGGLCVVHRPGCGVVGNDGQDNFFGELPLPAGATLLNYRFQPQWPEGLTAVDRGGWGSQGSYGARVISRGLELPLVVRWENTCQGRWQTLPVAYDISFVVRIPDGMDLGEPTSSPDALNTAICDPSTVPNGNFGQTATASTETSLTIGLFRREGPAGGGPRPYAGQFGLGNSGGKVLGVQNAEHFAIELVGDQGTSDDCGKGTEKTVVLSALERLTTEEMKSLFGSDVTYPRSFVACSYVDQAQIAISVTHMPSQ